MSIYYNLLPQGSSMAFGYKLGYPSFFKEKKFALYVKWCNAAMAKTTRSFFYSPKT